MPQNNAKTVRGNPDKTIPHRWKPGQSGNPGGRPKTAALSEAARNVLAKRVPNDPQGRTYAEAIADTLAQLALEGDIRAAQELTDRAEGRARQSVEIEHSRLRAAFDEMSREELEAYARDGALPDWFPRDEPIQ
jgi:Family of unknown function (DUF5681)